MLHIHHVLVAQGFDDIDFRTKQPLMAPSAPSPPEQNAPLGLAGSALPLRARKKASLSCGSIPTERHASSAEEAVFQGCTDARSCVSTTAAAVQPATATPLGRSTTDRDDESGCTLKVLIERPPVAFFATPRAVGRLAREDSVPESAPQKSAPATEQSSPCTPAPCRKPPCSPTAVSTAQFYRSPLKAKAAPQRAAAADPAVASAQVTPTAVLPRGVGAPKSILQCNTAQRSLSAATPAVGGAPGVLSEMTSSPGPSALKQASTVRQQRALEEFATLKAPLLKLDALSSLRAQLQASAMQAASAAPRVSAAPAPPADRRQPRSAEERPSIAAVGSKRPRSAAEGPAAVGSLAAALELEEPEEATPARPPPPGTRRVSARRFLSCRDCQAHLSSTFCSALVVICTMLQESEQRSAFDNIA